MLRGNAALMRPPLEERGYDTKDHALHKAFLCCGFQARPEGALRRSTDAPRGTIALSLPVSGYANGWPHGEIPNENL